MNKVEGTYILELPLKVEKWQSDIMNKRYETLRKIYNIILHEYVIKYKEMSKNKSYRDAISIIYCKEERKRIGTQIKELANKLGVTTKKIPADNVEYIRLLEERDNIHCSVSDDERKRLVKLKSDLEKENGFNEYGIFGLKNVGSGWKMSEFGKEQGIDARITQAMCMKNLWKSISMMLYNNCDTKFKRYGELNSVYGTKSNGCLCGINLNGNVVCWKRCGKKNEKGVYSNIYLTIDKDLNEYEAQAISNDIAYVGIIRKMIRGNYKYYVQITLSGIMPSKTDKQTGEFVKIKTGKVGLDIGTSTLAIVSDNVTKIVELADKAQPNQHKITSVQRKIDRSMRATNPNKFNEDGTIKKGNREKWNFSNNCKRLKSSLKEFHRKSAAIRKLQHEELDNYILTLGDEIYVEKMRFAGLQKRVKNTELNKNGKCKRKKRFGKSLANRAPATLLTILNNKLKSYGKELKFIDTYRCKASQFNHFNSECVKKPLSKRWNRFKNGDIVQRDLYSAFLIQNVNEDLQSYDENALREKYHVFKLKHDCEMDRIARLPKKQLSSIGIG